MVAMILNQPRDHQYTNLIRASVTLIVVIRHHYYVAPLARALASAYNVLFCLDILSMPRDYAKSAPKKRKPATRSNSRKAVTKTHSRWPAILSSFVVGMLVMYVFQTWDSRQEDFVKVLGEISGDTGAAPEKPHFDFYTLLPDSEVIVPDVAPQPLRGSNGSDHNVYMLQAGSFRNADDADSLRARLLLLNLDASIEKTGDQQAGIWYRVIIGPFTSRSKLAGTRATLLQKGIDNLVLKRKDNS